MRKCLVALTIVFACINTSFALNGLGTAASPWLIQSLADFDAFAANSAYWAGHTRLDTNKVVRRKSSKKALRERLWNRKAWLRSRAFNTCRDGTLAQRVEDPRQTKNNF